MIWKMVYKPINVRRIQICTWIYHIYNIWDEFHTFRPFSSYVLLFLRKNCLKTLHKLKINRFWRPNWLLDPKKALIWNIKVWSNQICSFCHFWEVIIFSFFEIQKIIVTVNSSNDFSVPFYNFVSFWEWCFFNNSRIAITRGNNIIDNQATKH